MALLIAFLLFLAIIILFISLTTSHSYFTREFLGKSVTDFLAILTLAATFTAFFSIVFSLQQTYFTRKNELKQITIDLFKELRGPHFNNVRDKCWAVKLQWDKDSSEKGYRYQITEAMFSENVNSATLSEQIQSIYDLIGFYSILSLYRDNESDIQSLSYFYYGWWRKFLYEVAAMTDPRREADLFSQADLIAANTSFMRQVYIDNISLNQVLRRLDALCGFEKIPANFEIHKSGG